MFALGFTKTESRVREPSEFLKKGVPVGRKIVFRIGAFNNNNNNNNKSINIAPNQSRLLSGALQNMAN